MSSFEAAIEKACKDVKIPGAILVASSSDGKFRYEKVFGTRSLKDPSPLKIDATMWLASCSKFMTTIAAMQCVEKGLLNLDDDVTGILPELKGRQILKGFEEGTQKPILVENTKKITLRHMLTHQSGLGYDVFNPVLMQYQTSRGVTPGFGGSRTLVQSYDYPLLFEPGESWEYSVGIDWAGEMVMRVTKMSLEDYMSKNIWAPLGIKHITFFPKKRPDVMERLADMSRRDCGITMFGTAEDPNAKLVYTDETVWNMDTIECHGGAGSYGSVLDYHKMLHSICSDDGKLLKPSTVDEMFKPQLTDAAQAKMQEQVQIPEMNQVYGGLPKDVRWDWGIGGIMNMNAYPGRSAGSIAWGGYPNLLWYCDRRGGMSGIIGTQIIPPGDVKVVELASGWAKAMYEMAGVKEKEKL